MTIGAQEKIPGRMFDFGGAFANVKHLDFGAKGDGVTDDTVAIQLALDTFDIVYLPPGTYIVSDLHLNTNNVLFGAGRSSILQQKASSSASLLALTDTDQVHVILADFSLDGNKSAQISSNDGINFDNSGVSGDPNHILSNVQVHHCKGNGIVIGAGARESRIINCMAYLNDGQGITCGLGGATDCFMYGCTSWQNGLSGFFLGYFWYVTNCKAFGNGLDNVADDGAGFLIQTVGLTITNCCAQENWERGFSFFAGGGVCKANVGSSLLADSNGGASFYFSGCTDSLIGESCASDTPSLLYHPDYAVYFETSAVGNYIECVTDGSFLVSEFELNGEQDNIIDEAIARHGRYNSLGQGIAGGDEHFNWGQPGSPATNNAYFTIKSETISGDVDSFLTGFDGSDVKQFFYFDFASGKLILGEDGGQVIPILPWVPDGDKPAAASVTGGLIYNTTTGKVQASAGGAWVDLH